MQSALRNILSLLVVNLFIFLLFRLEFGIKTIAYILLLIAPLKRTIATLAAIIPLIERSSRNFYCLILRCLISRLMEHDLGFFGVGSVIFLTLFPSVETFVANSVGTHVVGSELWLVRDFLTLLNVRLFRIEVPGWRLLLQRFDLVSTVESLGPGTGRLYLVLDSTAIRRLSCRPTVVQSSLHQ